MNYVLVIIEEAITELDDAFVWYETKSLGLGEKFIENIEKGFNFVKNNLKASEKQSNVVYRHVVNKFPYGIYYLIDKEKKQIKVIAILHFKRNPSIWKKRLE